MKNKYQLPSKKYLLRLWTKYSNLIEKGDGDSESIDKENMLICELENHLPFKDEEEHNHWLDLGSSFKYWEDWEELNMSIINRAATKKIDDLIEGYRRVAMDVCSDANFYDLFNTFSKLSNGWVKPLTLEWNKWWEEMSKNQDDVSNFMLDYEEIYGHKFTRNEIYRRFYGFETIPTPMFYSNSEEGKSDLLDCIFERYVEGLDEDELMWFYQRLIKELI